MYNVNVLGVVKFAFFVLNRRNIKRYYSQKSVIKVMNKCMIYIYNHCTPH